MTGWMCYCNIISGAVRNSLNQAASLCVVNEVTCNRKAFFLLMLIKLGDEIGFIFKLIYLHFTKFTWYCSGAFHPKRLAIACATKDYSLDDGIQWNVRVFSTLRVTQVSNTQTLPPVAQLHTWESDRSWKETGNGTTDM